MHDELERLPVAIVTFAGGGEVGANERARQLLPSAGPDPLDGLCPDDAERLRLAAGSVLDAEVGAHEALEVQLVDGLRRRVLAASVERTSEDLAVAVLVDVTEQDRMDRAFAALTDGVYTTDSDLMATWMPRRCAEALGLTSEIFEGVNVRDLLHPDDVERAESLVARAIGTPGNTFAAKMRVLHPEQLDAYYWVLAHAVWMGDDEVLGGLLVRIDTGRTDEAFDAVVADELGTTTLRDAAPQGFMNVALDGHIILSNQRARTILGRVGGDVDGTEWLHLVLPEDRPVVDAAMADAAKALLHEPVEVGLSDGRATVWVRLEIMPYYGPTGDVAGAFVILLDVTPEHEAKLELAAAKEQLWHQSRHDPLTGLANRLPFYERLGSVLPSTDGSPDGAAAAARRDDGRAPGILVCDLDGFKGVNDALGHREGDRVLCDAARRLESAVRSGDLLCRHGGDEFLVLCESVDEVELVAVADRVVAALSSASDADDPSGRVSVSVGAALAAPGDGPDDVIRRADRAMYEAKAAGGRGAVLAPASDGGVGAPWPSAPRPAAGSTRPNGHRVVDSLR